LRGRTQARAWHDGREVGEGPVAYRENARVEPMVSSRACRARPSAEWPSDAKKALRGKPRGRRERQFSRRGAVSAPALRGRTQARAWHDGREVGEGPVAYRGHARVYPTVSLRACGARLSPQGQAGERKPCGASSGTSESGGLPKELLGSFDLGLRGLPEGGDAPRGQIRSCRDKTFREDVPPRLLEFMPWPLRKRNLI
jgi:hypothetical protein